MLIIFLFTISFGATINNLNSSNYVLKINPFQKNNQKHEDKKIDLLKNINEKNFSAKKNVKTKNLILPKKITYSLSTKNILEEYIYKKNNYLSDNKEYLNKLKIDKNNAWRNFDWEKWEEPKNPFEYLLSPPYISGFGELNVYSLVVNADSKSRPYALKDEVYSYLTRKIKEIDFKIDYRFNLLIQAKISEEAEVNFNVSQEPDSAQKTDVSLRIRQTLIKFGYSEKKFLMGNFTNVNKKIDGVSIEGNEGSFIYNFAFGSEKSKNDNFTRNGDGGSVYALRYKPVLENSLQVWVNDQLQSLKKDYTINYFEGKIYFVTAKNSYDSLRFSYQYTNPIEEFIPIASNINLLGFNIKYDNKNQQNITQKKHQTTETFNNISSNGKIYLRHSPIIIESEKIFSDGILLGRNLDYYISYSSGVIIFHNKRLKNIKATYTYPETKQHTEEIIGNGENFFFYLEHSPLIENSDTLTLQGKELIRNQDYQLDTKKGMIILKYPLPKNEKLLISYKEKILSKEVINTGNDLDYTMEMAYIRQFAKSQEEINTRLNSESYFSTSNNFDSSLTINLNNWPLLEGSLSVKVNNATISNNAIEIDNYRGMLTINSALLNVTGELQINYSYFKEVGPQQWNFSGGNPNIDNYASYKNKLAHTIISNLTHPMKYDPFNQYIKVEYKNDTGVFQALEPSVDYDILFDVDAVKEGQIELIIYHNNNPPENGREYKVPFTLSNHDLFKVTYYYTNSDMPDAGEIVNEQFAIKYDQKINNNFSFSIEAARSNKEYSKMTASTTNTLIGTGEFNKAYTLSAQNIVENSETVYIDGNVLIRDLNYYINYQKGQIVFINLNPSNKENIYIEYNYYTTEASGQSEKQNKKGTAIALKTTLLDAVHLTNIEMIIVEDDFSPVGTTKYPAGSNILKLGTTIKPNNEWNIHANIFSNKKNSNFQSSSTGKILNYYENKYNLKAGYTPLDIFTINAEIDLQNYATETNVDDNLRPIDNMLNRYILSSKIGPSDFQTNLLINNFFNTDKSNKANPVDTLGRTIEIKNNLTLHKRALFLETSFRETTEYKTSANQEISDKTNKKYGTKVTLKPVNFIQIDGNYSKENISEFYNQSSTQNQQNKKSEAQDYGTIVSLFPSLSLLFIDKPSYTFSLNHKEEKSVLANQSPDLTHAQGNKVGFMLLNLTNFTFSNSFSHLLQSDEKIFRRGRSEEYNFSSFRILNEIFPITINPFTKRIVFSNNSDKIGNTSTLESFNESQSEYLKYGASWKPFKGYDGNIDFVSNYSLSSSTENKTNEIIQSRQTKPKQELTLQNNFELYNFFKTSHIHKNTIDKEQNITFKMATSDYSIQSITTFNRTSHFYSTTLKNILIEKIQPVYFNNLFAYDDYVDSSKGIKIRNQEKHDLFSTFRIFENLLIEPIIILDKTIQYSTISDNYTLQQVQNLYDQKIDKENISNKLKIQYPLIEKVNILANLGYENIQEKVFTKQSNNSISENNKVFDIYTLGIGLKTNIINGLTLEGNYNLNNNFDKKNNAEISNISHKITLLANYSPASFIKKPSTLSINDVLMLILRQSNINFYLEYNKGKGINNYELEETEILIGKTIETKIEEIDNLRSKLSFESTFEVPLTEQSNGLIEKFIFNSEAHIVMKNDYANKDGINYNIVGLIFSGKLEF
jgi:hypothetical protein